MDTAADVIDSLGGPAVVADFLTAHYERVNMKSVSAWKCRDSIPNGYWLALVAMAKSEKVNGITCEILTRIHTPPGLLPRVESPR